MDEFLHLTRYPIDRLDSDAGRSLVERCRRDLAQTGMFNLEGFLTSAGCARAVGEVAPVLTANSFTHSREHNIYFKKSIDGLAADHPALAPQRTTNHTICGDQMAGFVVMLLYEWPPFAQFLAQTMEMAELHTMADELAGANVLAYRHGEALNWHFDRSEFTTTLLLQAPDAGGEFEYRSDLRTDADPNYDGVARLLTGDDPEKRTLQIAAGTLNVFKGKNTAHRVTPVEGERDRIIAVLSYYEQPGRMFSDEERLGFYGRTG